MKKILFAATVFSHLASFHKPFIRWFQEQGYEVHAIGNPDYGRRNELEEMNVICFDVPFSRSPFSKENKKALNILKCLFQEQKYTLIHVHTPVAAFLVRYIAKKYSNSTVLYTAHGFHFFKGAPLLNWLLYYPAEKVATRWTDGLIVMNQEDYVLGEKLGFVPKKSLFYVHGVGVDTSYYSAIEDQSNHLLKELGLNSQDIVVTCVAELIQNKKHKFLLAIWEQIEKKYPHVKLFLVGEGKEREKLEALIQEKGLRNVYLLGFRSDVAKILSLSDIVTLVSAREGLPRALMEAMANGKPIVASDVRGSRELVDHNKTGFLIPLDDVQKGVIAFDELIKSPVLCAEMGTKGQEKIKAYDLRSVLQEMGGIYSNFLKRSKRGSRHESC